jgi:hypothetical protein
MVVKEAFIQEMHRALQDIMECYVDHVVEVTQKYIIHSIIIIQNCIAVILDILFKGTSHLAESVVSVQENFRLK